MGGGGDGGGGGGETVVMVAVLCWSLLLWRVAERASRSQFRDQRWP